MTSIRRQLGDSIGIIFTIGLHVVVLTALYFLAKPNFLPKSHAKAAGQLSVVQLTFVQNKPPSVALQQSALPVVPVKPRIKQPTTNPLTETLLPKYRYVIESPSAHRLAIAVAEPSIIKSTMGDKPIAEKADLSPNRAIADHLKDLPSSSVAVEKIERAVVYTARPDYAYNPLPSYPVALKEQGIGGTVWLRVWVDISGLPQEIVLVKESGYRLLDEAALRAVKQWKFIPAKNGDVDFASWVEFPIRFKLNG
jgi:periplasmic protein TonB